MYATIVLNIMYECTSQQELNRTDYDMCILCMRKQLYADVFMVIAGASCTLDGCIQCSLQLFTCMQVISKQPSCSFESRLSVYTVTQRT